MSSTFVCFLKTGCNSLHAKPWLVLELRSTLPLACPPAGIKIMLHHLPTSMVCTNHKFSGGNYNMQSFRYSETVTNFGGYDITTYLKQNTMVVTLLDIGGIIYCPGFTLKYSKKRGR